MPRRTGPRVYLPEMSRAALCLALTLVLPTLTRAQAPLPVTQAPAAGTQAPPPAAPAPAVAVDKKPEAKPEKKPEPDKKKFTLQISSFQDKSEADALVARLTAAGYKPYVILSDVEGKGTFFRVRIGEYRSKVDASDAKDTFEKKQKIIAYVTKI